MAFPTGEVPIGTRHKEGSKYYLYKGNSIWDRDYEPNPIYDLETDPVFNTWLETDPLEPYLTGDLTEGYIPVANDAKTLIDSNIFKSGTYVGINTITPSNVLHVADNANNIGILIENTKTSSTTRVALDLKTQHSDNVGGYARMIFRPDLTDFVITIRDEGVSPAAWVQFLQFNYRTKRYQLGNPSILYADLSTAKTGIGYGFLPTNLPAATLHVNGDVIIETDLTLADFEIESPEEADDRILGIDGYGNVKVTEETDPIFSAWDKSTGITIYESQILDLQDYLVNPLTTRGDIIVQGATVPERLAGNNTYDNKYLRQVIVEEGQPISTSWAEIDAGDIQNPIWVQKSGDGMSGYLTLYGDPISAKHAATKAYVDAMSGGLRPFPYVHVVDDTGNNSPSEGGRLTIDDYQLNDGDSVLFTNLPDYVDNGIYVITDEGGDIWTFSRRGDADGDGELYKALIPVKEGTVYSGSVWYCTVEETYEVGVDDITFIQFIFPSSIYVGIGLDKIGNEIFLHEDFQSQGLEYTLNYSNGSGGWDSSEILLNGSKLYNSSVVGTFVDISEDTLDIKCLNGINIFSDDPKLTEYDGSEFTPTDEAHLVTKKYVDTGDKWLDGTNGIYYDDTVAIGTDDYLYNSSDILHVRNPTDGSSTKLVVSGEVNSEEPSANHACSSIHFVNTGFVGSGATDYLRAFFMLRYYGPSGLNKTSQFLMSAQHTNKNFAQIFLYDYADEYFTIGSTYAEETGQRGIDNIYISSNEDVYLSNFIDAEAALIRYLVVDVDGKIDVTTELVSPYTELTTNTNSEWDCTTGLNKTWSLTSEATFTLTITNLTNGCKGDCRIDTTDIITITLNVIDVEIKGAGRLDDLEAGVYHLSWAYAEIDGDGYLDWNMRRYYDV